MDLDLPGIEPGIFACKANVLPLNYKPLVSIQILDFIMSDKLLYNKFWNLITLIDELWDLGLNAIIDLPWIVVVGL